MQEEFLHYVWKYGTFNTLKLKTTLGEDVTIRNLGQHNLNSGPDFFNAQLIIGEQLWAGNLEIHVKSSDWYLHNHQQDKTYDNVILHVVWEHDSDVFRNDNTIIPTLELKRYVDKGLQHKYRELMLSKSWINCEAQFPEVDDFLISNWLERLYIERLEQKSITIEGFLEKSNNNWEAVLFKMLLKNFGLKINGEAFLSIANSVDYSVIRKLRHNDLEIEALLFGQAGLLQDTIEDSHFQLLKTKYEFLKGKYKLDRSGMIPVKFFRLRPQNFPTIRLSQFASLYQSRENLFSKIVDVNSLDDFYKILTVGVSEFWKSHYTFLKNSKTSRKQLTKSFIDLLVINTIIPIKFSYAKSQGKSIDKEIFKLIQELNIENNTIVSKFLDYKPFKKNALTSQALLQMKNAYCDKNKCLNCAIGNSLIIKN
ncbi:DUF2851 family protein [Winogradskyella aurantia]|uniref:DUF2851 domain-containing protein n=1 Tax=Winogradskyella aurantia TaxID=1915063 RepID=A0A265UUW2_9FLAO|nr:DUF2851 family protein [Winogradskyella aurantia]OZV69002.1 hypothetical protein CA834_05950 [Winogradskyella aurantia]